jgi:hypothetical protein
MYGHRGILKRKPWDLLIQRVTIAKLKLKKLYKCLNGIDYHCRTFQHESSKTVIRE